MRKNIQNAEIAVIGSTGAAAGIGLLAATAGFVAGPIGSAAVIASFGSPVSYHLAGKAQRRAAIAAATATHDAHWEHALRYLPDDDCRAAVSRFYTPGNPYHAQSLWCPLGLGDEATIRDGVHLPGTWPLIWPDSPNDPGVWATEFGAQVRLQLPPGYTAPSAYAHRLTDLANALRIPEVRINFIGQGALILDLVTQDPIHTPEWQNFLKEYHSRLHTALNRLIDPWKARALWTGLGLGYEPDYRTGTPGSWPQLIPFDDTNPDDIGIETVQAGLRVRLTMPEDCDREEFQKRLGKLASALNVPAIRIITTDGNEIVLELRVLDPLAKIIWSPFISVQEVLDIDGRTKETIYHPTLTPESLSCYDDIAIAINEYNETLTINLVKSAHFAIGGATRTGKSILLNQLCAAVTLMRDARLTLIDPNGAATPAWYQCAHRVCEDNDADAATAILEEIRTEMRHRKALLRFLGDRITEFSARLPLEVVVIDETANFRKSKEFAHALEDIAAQGAKYGIRLVICTQKHSEDNVPTGVRTNCFDRLTFRVNDPRDFPLLFPDAPEFAAEARRRNLPQGVMLASLLSHPEFCLARGLYLPTEACFVIGDMVVAHRRATGGFVREFPPIDPDNPYLDLIAEYQENPRFARFRNNNPAPAPDDVDPDDPEDLAAYAAKGVDELDDWLTTKAASDDEMLGKACICQKCGKVFRAKTNGRPPKYCSNLCKGRAYRERQRDDDDT